MFGLVLREPNIVNNFARIKKPPEILKSQEVEYGLESVLPTVSALRFYSVIPIKSKIKAYSKATSFKRSKRPEAPP